MSFEGPIGTAPADGLVHIGISGDTNQFHVGFLYTAADGHAKFIDLAWHLILRNAAPEEGIYWQTISKARDPITAKILTAQLIRIAVYRNAISYGFFWEGEAFTPDGQLINFDEPGMGLTCATFVLAVLSSLSIKVCLRETWQARPEDRVWQRTQIRQMRGHSQVTCEHLWGMKRYVGSVRFRPEEVAACAASPKGPLNFEDAIALAEVIKSQVAS